MRNKILIIFLMATFFLGCRTQYKPGFYEEYANITKAEIFWPSAISEYAEDTNNVHIVNELYVTAQKNARQMVALGSFYSALLAMEIGDFKYANSAIDNALLNWSDNIEFVMLKILCLSSTGENEIAIEALDSIKSQQPLPEYIEAMVDAVEKTKISDEKLATLTSRQLDFVKVLQQMSETSKTNFYSSLYMKN